MHEIIHSQNINQASTQPNIALNSQENKYINAKPEHYIVSLHGIIHQKSNYQPPIHHRTEITYDTCPKYEPTDKEIKHLNTNQTQTHKHAAPKY